MSRIIFEEIIGPQPQGGRLTRLTLSSLGAEECAESSFDGKCYYRSSDTQIGCWRIQKDVLYLVVWSGLEIWSDYHASLSAPPMCNFPITGRHSTFYSVWRFTVMRISGSRQRSFAAIYSHWLICFSLDLSGFRNSSLVVIRPCEYKATWLACWAKSKLQ